ncbi:Alpha/Beta hydrolase protein [Aspergillus pseudoustus]|uniref:Alpha/Beta hydrolase protein n=1 Tax=Aspergillus pseudoustus TaxID=1810923 RepID=A0ABR4L1Y0_9EURO
MVATCDMEYTDILAAIQAMIRKSQPLPLDDAAGRRAMIAQRFSTIKPFHYDDPKVDMRQYTLELPDGHKVEIYGFHPSPSSDSSPPSPTAAVMYLHGGGMTMGTALDSRSLLTWYSSSAGLPLFSVEYRLAPEYPYPTPVEDCYASLKWLHQEAAHLNIDPSRIAVMGDSAGGGLSAAVALLARDRAELPHPLAKQILIQPMLDDRNGSAEPSSYLSEVATWTWDDNLAGWTALLGSRTGSDDVPCYASPARATDLRGLPSTYIDVGMLDIFVSQVVEFASRLRAAGVEARCELYPQVPHAFHSILAETQVAHKARQNHIHALLSF